MKTFSAKVNMIKRSWYVVDATNKILGRLASNVAIILRGKHKVEYTPHVDTGDYVIVLNAMKILITGNKCINKIYYHHTGYVGHIKSMTFKDMLCRSPKFVIEHAVKGMLPKGPLGRMIFRKLKVYSSDRHMHVAQNPQILDF